MEENNSKKEPVSKKRKSWILLKDKFLIPFFYAVLAAFLYELIRYLSDDIINLFINVSQTFADYYYKTMSVRYYTPVSSETGLVFIIFILLGFHMSSSLVQNLMNKAELKIHIMQCTLDELTNEEAEIMDSIEDTLTFYKRVRSIVRNISIIFLVVGLADLMFSTAVIEGNAVLRKDLILIKPYVETAVIDSLEAQWVLVNNEEDHDRVKSFIDSAKELYY